MSVSTDQKYCLFCGYNLHGLPSDLCPECGRAFDPTNPRTFDTHQGGRRRAIRRRLILGIAGCLLAFTLWGAAPRRIDRTYVAFQCTRCGERLTVTRSEPVPADGFPVRLPAWISREQKAGLDEHGQVRTPCPGPHPAQVYRFDLMSMRVGKLGSDPDDGVRNLTINGVKVTPQSAADVLHAMSVRGVAVSIAVGPDDKEDCTFP
ncbi:MAG: hypothetical protein BroJett003_20940 [Planctomycetota bacterium]|nr:MAG: hypothetical protein BroJett003_20940 [Planctomycetota bacterium]